MSLFPFPYLRKTYASLGNPGYVDDVLAANELTVQGMAALTGLGSTGFAIVSGLAFSSGTYGPGYIYLNGQFYAVNTSFGAGVYLYPTPIDVLPKPFSDTNNRNIYTQLIASTTTDPTGGGAGASPVFTGTMNAYRIDLTTLSQAVQSAQAELSLLGTAAFRNVGTTPGTVAAGDDARFGYSVSDANALFATKASVLLRGNPGGNNNGFVPANDFDPATKAYVDANSSHILVRSTGPINVGDIPTGGITVGIPFGITLASTSYQVHICVYSNGNPHDDTTFSYTVINSSKGTTGVNVRFQEWTGITQNISFDWFILSH